MSMWVSVFSNKYFSNETTFSESKKIYTQTENESSEQTL